VEVHSKWYVITGEVNKPGPYALTRDMSVLEALSSAGGFHEFAKQNKIYIMHNDNGKTVRLPFHYADVLKGKHLDENVRIHDGDTIVVP
jgi:polysaccharide biosynthesis/export protein